ncbi:hypothetical protein DFH07DRAFT_1059468 [Mycena maculata]|uniref:Uncharacterized protein n=1 Tax=Mycena maculata TaxID=230809 RepID=A0AAD7NIP4_9AGAR|nr:hypothetical protein DFH07DRAFT_1059468 [Mycena maculata]
MIHLDRNHHPSLSTTGQNKDLILPGNPITWSALDDDYSAGEYPQVHQKQNPPTTKGPMTPTDTTDPHPASAASSSASPADGNSASPTRERSSSLSPAPSPNVAPDAPPAAVSRQSTPLSELSPPPDDDDDDAPKQEDSTSEKSQNALTSPPSKPDDHDAKPSQQSSNLMPTSSPSTRPSPPIDSIATPSAAGTEPTSPAPGDPKVAVMLELNEELLKICIEFNKRHIALAEPQFQAYSARLHSNLQWGAKAVDPTFMNQIIPLPIIEAPPPLDFLPTDRIQELYQELPKVFAKDMARRASLSSSPVSLKRDRSEDLPGDVMNKRRDTGETKMPASMMPPPPIPSPVASAAASATNRTATPPVPDAPQNPMIGDPQQRTTRAQVRAAQQQQQATRQMSPPSNVNGNPAMGNGPPPGNAVAGPSGGLDPATLPPQVRQLATMLQTPGHPFVQYMIRMVPNFQQMPPQMQLQKMHQAQTAMQRERAQNGQGPGPGPGFGAQTSPVSPITQMGMGGRQQSPQGSMFPMNAGVDLRAMNSTPLPGGGPGGGGMGMPMNGMNGISPQQRQLLLMQQQQRGGGGGGMGPGPGPGGPMGMGMNAQMAFQQQQEQRIRMEQQQRMVAAGGSPPHPGSPMMGNDFPALRSNASIPGIARIARSPSDGSPMTPRMTPSRGASLGAEDYQRAMMQQQQQQQRAGGMPGQNGGNFGAQGFPPQPTPGWQQNQMQQQAMQMHGGGGGGGQYGMGGPRPGSGYGGAPSPPGSGGGMSAQNWAQGGPGGYPFGSPGGGGDLGMQRHMSGTPAPQMQQNGPVADAEFDPFSWA